MFSKYTELKEAKEHDKNKMKKKSCKQTSLQSPTLCPGKNKINGKQDISIYFYMERSKSGHAPHKKTPEKKLPKRNTSKSIRRVPKMVRVIGFPGCPV